MTGGGDILALRNANNKVEYSYCTVELAMMVGSITRIIRSYVETFSIYVCLNAVRYCMYHAHSSNITQTLNSE